MNEQTGITIINFNEGTSPQESDLSDAAIQTAFNDEGDLPNFNFEEMTATPETTRTIKKLLLKYKGIFSSRAN